MSSKGWLADFLASLKGTSNYSSGFKEEDRTAGRSVSGVVDTAPMLPITPTTRRGTYEDIVIPPPTTKEPSLDAGAYLVNRFKNNQNLPLPPKEVVAMAKLPNLLNDSNSLWWSNASFDEDGNLPMSPDDTRGLHKDNWRNWTKPIEGSPTKARSFFDPILDRFAQVESRADPKANIKNPEKAGGMYQFTIETAKAMGLTPEDRYDPVKSRKAAKTLLEQTTNSMGKMIKRMPQPHEIYLGHQQGAAGASALINRPNMNAIEALMKGAGLSRKQARAHILNNHGTSDMTSSEFIEMMGSIFYDGWYMKDKFHANRKAQEEGL